MNERYALVGYAAVLGALLAVGTPDVQAFGYCCDGPTGCGSDFCCPPQGSTANCSRDLPYYCMDTGGDWCS
jgi:hypothetical protein